MILGVYEIRDGAGKLRGAFKYTEAPGSQSLANTASLERYATLKVHGPKGEVLTRTNVRFTLGRAEAGQDPLG